ncbi:beta-1,4-N-acetylgalactosaminyltransferase bre-4 isoform X2 [Cylas formicarius]|uniref:beta-1,4-N-acetylgalactosaminyltransferase bre-4 isoform X2 n=1 Tax=Cylas formicarius TaxID=197179 RepID=UPI0029587FA8|nr:beta-1,4-N-acetylgalactosaminyltransferase bre-4 isoform X2 [Cylas formicarius]
MIIKCVITVAIFFIVIAIYFPARHARRYDYIRLENVSRELVLKVRQGSEENLPKCAYDDVILNNQHIEVSKINYFKTFIKPKAGATAIVSDQFKKINGMSNKFFGWGGEDDEFYSRLQSANLVPYRFSPEISKYSMQVHKRALPSKDRYEKLENSADYRNKDGLNSLTGQYSVVLEKLFTRILIY